MVNVIKLCIISNGSGVPINKLINNDWYYSDTHEYIPVLILSSQWHKKIEFYVLIRRIISRKHDKCQV